MPKKSSSQLASGATVQDNPLPVQKPTPLRRRSLPLLLLQGREQILCHFRPILNHFGLTEQQWRILRGLSVHGPMEQRLLCDACQILGPSLAGILSRMHELNLIERHKVATDQRRVVISLTAQSQSLLDQIAPLIEAQYKKIEQAWGADLLQDAYAQIDRLLACYDIPVEDVDLPPVK